MKIVNCGYNYRHHQYFRINRPRGSGDCILLIVRSPAQFVFGGVTYFTKGNAVVLFREGTPQLYGAHGAEYVNDWVHFEATEAETRQMEERGLVFDEVVELYDVLPLSNLIQNIFRELYSDNQNATDSAQLYFSLLLNKISDMRVSALRNGNSAILEKFARLRTDIYSEPQRDWCIPEVARELAMSESYLQHEYKRCFGRSIKRDVTASRIEYSKYLLFSTDYTVAAISELCGYRNDVHFMRVFKENVGMTPTAYRNQSIHNKDKVDRTKNPFCL